MVRHIVLFKIKPEFKAEIPQLAANFRAMQGQIDGLESVESGADYLGSERSYDLALICTFRDRAAFDAYQNDPAHVKVKKRIHEARSGSVACDFEFS